MKTLQEQFYENALQGKEFTLAVENGETLHYVSTQNRDLTLYYEYRERDRNASYWTALYDVKNISLIAIVVGDRVLTVDRYRDPILFEEKAYPDNMYDIDTYKEEIEKKIQELQDKGLAGAVYTQLSDVEEETNGLYTYDRKVCKVERKL